MQQDDKRQLPPVAPSIFTSPAEGEEPALLGGFCPACGQDFFPRPPRCPLCLGQVQEKNLGSTGRLYTYTVVRVKAPWGLPCPYGLAYVDMDHSDLRVLGLLAPDRLAELRIGLPLRLAVGELGCDVQGNPCLRPYFHPDGSREAGGVDHG